MKTIEDIKDVTIYLRRSQGDDLNILEKHELEAVALCNRMGWSYTIEREIGSGDSIDDRPVMTELLETVESGIIDAVVVSYYDRLGRGSGKDQDRIFESFLMGDVLIVELFPFNVYNVENDANEEQLAFKQFMARRDLKTINKRLTMGRNAAIKLGRWVFSTKPYGYDYDRKNKKLTPNPETSKILRSIFDMYLTGEMSTNDIAWKLNQQKIPSPTGLLWHHKTVNEILKNEVYTGIIVYNKSKLDKRAKKERGKNKKRIYTPKSEWLTVHNTHDALVSPDEYKKVLEIMSINRTKGGGNSVNYLSGIVKCYNCNKTLPIMKNKDGDDVLAKCYNCNECRGGQTELVMDAIYESLDVVKEQLNRINEDELLEIERKSLLSEIEKTQKKIETNYNALDNIERAMEDGLYSYDKAKEKIQERRDIIYELEDIIRRKNEQLERFSIMSNNERIKRIEEFYQQMKEHGEDRVEVNKIIKSIINNVVWKRTERNEVEITVNFL